MTCFPVIRLLSLLTSWGEIHHKSQWNKSTYFVSFKSKWKAIYSSHKYKEKLKIDKTVWNLCMWYFIVDQSARKIFVLAASLFCSYQCVLLDIWKDFIIGLYCSASQKMYVQVQLYFCFNCFYWHPWVLCTNAYVLIFM